MELIGQEGTAIDISCFDQVIMNFYSNGAQFNEAHDLLIKFQMRSDAWLLVQQIVTGSQVEQSRFFALKTFIDGARSNWNILDENQRNFFKQFFFNLVIEWSRNAVSEKLLNSADQALIEVLKNEWPAYWPSFMHDFLMETKSSISCSINGLRLLSMLSEETHEYHDELLTTDRLGELSRALENDFNLIFTHLESIFLQATDVPLIQQTLLTLSNYLHWIDLQKVTSTTMCQHLVANLFPNPNFRYPVLCCFDAIATHVAATADQSMCQIFELFVHNVRITLGDARDITEVYNEPTMVKKLIQTIGDFLSLDQSSLLQGILTESATFALLWLVQLTQFCQLDAFKIAVEYWADLTRLFCLEQHKVQPPPQLIFQLQEIFVLRMASPPELAPLIEQNIDEAQGPDLYELMRQTIVFLSNLYRQNMSQVLVAHLSNPNNKQGILNSCYAIGAITGTFPLQLEQDFISHCLQVLFRYLDSQIDENEKMILSGCYLFICSCYPRFLSKNWVFLKQLTDKIAHLLQVNYRPLQEVTLNIFKILATRVARPLVIIHPGQQKSVITDYIENSNQLALNLSFDLIPILYQALAMLIVSMPSEAGDKKQKLCMQLLVLPMHTWEATMKQLNSTTAMENQIAGHIIFPLDVFSKVIQIKEVVNIFYQVNQIVSQTIDLYKFFTGEISKVGLVHNLVKMKAAILNFYKEFIKYYHTNQMVPTLIEMLITDYSTSSPDLRFHQIIDCITALIETIGPDSQSFIDPIFNGVVIPTFEMISSSFDNYPEIRLSHFLLLSSLMTKVFASVQSFNQEAFSMMLKCLLWGVTHPQNDISSLALNCVSDCVQKIAQNPDDEFKRVFYDQFYLMIVFELFNVMTDRSHKFIFATIAQTLNHLFMQVNAHLIILNGSESTENYLADSLTHKLLTDFPHIRQSVLLEFSRSLITEARNFGNFKELLRTFLIQLRKVMPTDRDLYREEKLEENKEIGGFFGPAEAMEDDDGISEF